MWEKALSVAEKLNVSEPTLPRRRKVPRRFETGNAEAEFPTTISAHYRKVYYKGLDLIINCVKNRFEQPGYQVYRNVQDVLQSSKT